MVELREITKDNLDDVIKLKISKDQEEFISSTAYALAQAWVYKDTAYPFAIYVDNALVGFIMLGYYEAKNQYTIWKFLIDERYQSRGYGKQALKLAINYLTERFHVREIYVGVIISNDVAKHLYHSLGFRESGATDGHVLEMRLKI